VQEYGGLLAKTLDADTEIVELAAYLHDIAAVQNYTSLPRHPAVGAAAYAIAGRVNASR